MRERLQKGQDGCGGDREIPGWGLWWENNCQKGNQF